MLRRVRRRAALLVLVAVASATAGCGGESPRFDACALLPEARIANATGMRVLTASNRDQSEKTATCSIVFEQQFDDPKDFKLMSVLVGRVGTDRIPGLFVTADSAADLDALTLGDTRKQRIGELGDRAFLYTWPKGSSFRIVASRGGDFVSLDGQNVKEKGGEFLVRDVFVALRSTAG
jgi:hypothetical protein